MAQAFSVERGVRGRIGFPAIVCQAQKQGRQYGALQFSRRRSDLKPREVCRLLSVCGIERQEFKVKRAVDHSLSVVAAFASKNSRSSGERGFLSQLGVKKQRELVGFGLASGDEVAVAVIHDIVVHPELQGEGLGTRLIDRLTRQLAMDGVYEVAVFTPTQLEPFFTGCGFGPDREDTVPMLWRYSTTHNLKPTLEQKLLESLEEWDGK